MLHKPSVLSDKSTHSNIPFSLGGISFTATMISKPRNGSLLQLATDQGFRNYVGQALRDLRVSEAYSPKPKFTDRICRSSELTMGVQVGPYVLHRTAEGEFGDGVILGRCGESYLVSPSNCPTTLMASASGKALALHTGRFCLIDEHGLVEDVPAPGRRHTSIIFSALELLGNPEDVHVKVLWGIHGHHYPHDMKHPTLGKKNEKMRHVISTLWGESSVPMQQSVFYLDLPKLIRDQCVSRGVPKENIDLCCAYQPPSGTWTDGAVGKERNLVIITRRS